MACMASLKQEVKLLESLFPKEDERFQIHTATLDELMCQFIGADCEKIVIRCNFTVSETILIKHFLNYNVADTLG